MSPSTTTAIGISKTRSRSMYALTSCFWTAMPVRYSDTPGVLPISSIAARSASIKTPR